VLRSVAVTGLYDTDRYATASEARMAVLNHFAGCDWTLDQVRAGITGPYTGLAALYGDKLDRLLNIEWTKAQAWTATRQPAKTHSPRTSQRYALISDTSPNHLTGGIPQNRSPRTAASLHELVNDLEAILYGVLDWRFKQLGRDGIGLKTLMRSVLGFMRMNEFDIVDVGCRALAVATGSSHETTARLLRVLERESAGILTRVERGRGRNADLYVVQLPPELEQTARTLAWRKGKIYGIRPVFRALGHVSALVYEAIERARYSPTTADLIRAAGISRNTVSEHVARMETLGMIRRHHGAWQVVATTNLRQLADRLGVTEDCSAQITLYRKQRAAWHAWLDRHLVPQIAEHELHDVDIDEYWLPPTNDDYAHHHTLWDAGRSAA